VCVCLCVIAYVRTCCSLLNIFYADTRFSKPSFHVDPLQSHPMFVSLSLCFSALCSQLSISLLSLSSSSFLSITYTLSFSLCLQRGGSPSNFDRVLGTRLGVKAVELLAEGVYNQLVSLRTPEIVGVPLDEATRGQRLVRTYKESCVCVCVCVFLFLCVFVVWVGCERE
jgi:hypothetical protein